MRKNKFVSWFLVFIAGEILGYKLIAKVANKRVTALLGDKRKFRDYYYFVSYWLQMKIQGESIEGYFHSLGVNNITIYGMGELGCLLYEELKGTGIHIVQAIDRNLGKKYPELTMCQMADMSPETEIIVVTPIFAFEKIEKELREYYSGKIISLEDVVYGEFK